jgi:hypothetical protein
MKAQVTLIRATGGEFVARKLRGTALLAGIIAAIVLAVTLWLTTFSAWWWLLAVIVIAGILLLTLAYLAAAFVIRALRPNLTKEQKAGVRDFVDKLERVTDNIGTPLPLIIFQVVRDILWPRQQNYIKTVATDSTSLHKDLAALQKLFTTEAID